MPKLTSSAVSNLRITLSSEPDALYCPGAELRGVMTFSSDRALQYRCVSVQLATGAVGRNHKDHSVSDRLAHYITHFIGKEMAAESVDENLGAEGVVVAEGKCNVDAEVDPQPVVGHVAAKSSNELPAGEHSFPFAFVIPHNTAGSASYRVLDAKLDVTCGLLGVVSAVGSWAAVRTALQVPVASIVPRLQVGVEDIPVDEKKVVPLSGIISNNGAAEVRYSVSHRCLCLQDPQPLVISVAVDNVGGKKPIEAITARLMQYFDMDLLRCGRFLTRPAVVAESKLRLDGDRIPARARGTAGGNLTLELVADDFKILPTFTTEHLRVRHVLQLDLKGGKDPIDVPITVFHFIDETDQVPWWHHGKVLPSLRLQQWYEVPAAAPSLDVTSASIAESRLAVPSTGSNGVARAVVGTVIDVVSSVLRLP